MKKILAAMLMLVIVLAATPALARETHTSGDYVYEIASNGALTIVDYTGEHKDIILPVTLDGYAITAIGEEAFACEEKQSEMVTVTLPEDVISIGEKAFWNRNIRLINLPDKLESIGYGAFGGCDSCNFRVDANHPCFAVIDDALYDKARRELLWIPSVEKGRDLLIPDGILSVGEYACSHVTIEGTLTLPETVTRIGDYAFENSTLTALRIPAAVETIGEEAFSTCGTAEIKLCAGSVLSEVEDYAFNNSGLTIILPQDGFAKLEEIGKYAFAETRMNGSVTIPEDCRIVSEGAFSGVRGLELAIEDGVEVIEAYAFTGTQLENVYLPESLNMLSASAFDDLVEFTVEKNSYAQDWAEQNARIYSIKGEKVDDRWITGADKAVPIQLGDVIRTDGMEFLIYDVMMLEHDELYIQYGLDGKEIGAWGSGNPSEIMLVFKMNTKYLENNVYVGNRVYAVISCDAKDETYMDYACLLPVDFEAQGKAPVDEYLKGAALCWIPVGILDNLDLCDIQIGVMDTPVLGGQLMLPEECDHIYEIDLTDLFNNLMTGASVERTALCVGHAGDDVAKLQRHLMGLGYDVPVADGIFGRGTEQAVMAFQHDNGLPETGVANMETMNTLYNK